MKFTQEQINYINYKLRLADELQAKNGNKLYTLEEIQEKYTSKNKELEHYTI